MDKKIPVHVAIIPDGNRRWAKEKGLPSIKGHSEGAQKTTPALIKALKQYGVKYVTFWALSTENLVRRPKSELRYLMSLLKFFLKEKIEYFKKENIRLKVIGDITKLETGLQKLIKKAVEETENNSAITVIFALNYGGRDEIIRAVKKILREKKGNIDGNLTKELFSEYLDTKGIPDPDLIIRTGKEQRTSGFMLWQSEYSEFHFAPFYYPDFSPDKLDNILSDFSMRQRRFGGQ